MNKKELEKLNECKERHRILLNRVKSINQMSADDFENLTESTKRQFDQNYGELLGIEFVLSRMGLNVESLD